MKLQFSNIPHAVLFWLNVFFCVLNIAIALFDRAMSTSDMMASLMTATLNGIVALWIWPEGK
jgi:hypothetical protein